MAVLNDNEQRALRLFAKWFVRPSESPLWIRDSVIEQLQIDEEAYGVLMSRFESWGLVRDTSTDSNYFYRFDIHPSVVDKVHDMEAAIAAEKEASPPDLVEQVIQRAKGHPYISWLIVILLGLTFALALVNGIFDLINNLITTFGDK